jgi:hypothetical protein
MRFFLTASLLGLVLAPPVHAGAAAGDTRAAVAATPGTEAAASKPRLRFRGRGPVCMCSSASALSEQDIQKAAVAMQAGAAAGTTSGKTTETRSKQ